MPRLKSLYRPSGKKNVWVSRYCSKWKSNKSDECLAYETFEINTNLKSQWAQLQAAEYIMVPLDEL